MSARAVAAGVAVAALALLAPAGTQAAWTDDATSTAPAALTATGVPPPALTCTRVGLTAQITWPAASMPGPGAPAIDYSARVVGSSSLLSIGGSSVRTLVIGLLALVGAILGDTRTVEVTASVDFGVATWKAISTTQVKVALISFTPGVTCV